MPTPPIGTDKAVLGGVPRIEVDVPVATVLFVLFFVSAMAHMSVLQSNRRKDLKFLFSGMLFGLCMFRSIALVVRMVWSTMTQSLGVSIASGILTQMGSVLVLIINLFLTQRIVRGYHPRFGWHHAIQVVTVFLIACAAAGFITGIVVAVQSILTHDPDVRRKDHIAQLVVGTYIAVLAFLPVPVVVLSALVPSRHDVEKFGSGRWRSKLALVLFTSLVATLGAGFRVGISFSPARPADDPAWYHSVACYYIFNYATDFVISSAYLFSRFDRRFIVPNGAKRPVHYPASRTSTPHAREATSSMAHLNADQAPSPAEKEAPERIARPPPAHSSPNQTAPAKAREVPSAHAETGQRSLDGQVDEDIIGRASTTSSSYTDYHSAVTDVEDYFDEVPLAPMGENTRSREVLPTLRNVGGITRPFPTPAPSPTVATTPTTGNRIKIENARDAGWPFPNP